LYPFFAQLVDEAIELRNKYMPSAGLALLSNSSCSQLHEQPVLEAVRKFDMKIFKLDAGDSDLFAKINQPHPEIQFDRVIALLRSLDRLIIQTLFMDGVVSNCTDQAVESLIICYKIIRPQSVQIYSLDREPADMRLKKVSPARLEQIKNKILEEIPSLPIEVYT
jgi:wyosine [tRNA(Phe)-imidazoG37] synthetase (radical SAM superfamily)